MLAVVPMLMVVTSCNKKSTDASKVRFNLTDAPAQFDAMFIDVTGIQVHTEGGGWTSLHSSLGVINILDYVNGSTAIVAEGELAAGTTIDAIHLMLGSNNSVVVNGVSHALTNTAALQSGLTVAINNTLQAGGSYDWTIDFDAAQSVMADATGSFAFTPTIRLIVDPLTFNADATGTGGGSTNSTGGISIGGSSGVTGSVGASGSTSGSGTVVIGGLTGNISGSLSATAGLASVCIAGSDGTSVCTMTDLTGHFTIQSVASGSYTMQIDPVLPLLSTHTISNFLNDYKLVNTLKSACGNHV